MRNPNDMNMISAKSTEDLDVPSPDPYAPLPQRDWFPQDIPPYEDSIDISPDALDPAMADMTDDPTELFGVSPLAFRGELGRTAVDEGWDNEKFDDEEAEDYREDIEDRDENSYDLAA